MNPNMLGKLVAYRRTKFAHRTQPQLALAADISQSHLSRIETGQETPSLDVLIRLANVLGLGDEPGILLDALAGKLDETFALKKASVLPVPEDFNEDEWLELENALDFIVWKRQRMLPYLADLAAANDKTTEEVVKQIETAQKHLSALEKRLNQLTVKQLPEPKPPKPNKDKPA